MFLKVFSEYVLKELELLGYSSSGNSARLFDRKEFISILSFLLNLKRNEQKLNKFDTDGDLVSKTPIIKSTPELNTVPVQKLDKIRSLSSLSTPSKTIKEAQEKNKANSLIHELEQEVDDFVI